MGLLTRVVSDTELERDTMSLATDLAKSSASALAFTKQLFYQLDGRTLPDGIALGARVNAAARSTPDFREAIARFLRR
jgi:enoyl-CoA hydratase/carnithine racemase